LSGGQKQRVAIARALAKEPELLLLDEPFGQIDNFKKRSLRRMLFSYLKDKNISCIVATHDAEDALSFADKMIAIKDGKILAASSPEKLYKDPESAYVAYLFEDVNDVVLGGEQLLLYPHQIKIVEKSEFKATVLNTYFKGFYWVIEVRIDDQIIFLNHHEGPSKESKVFLKINRES